MKTSESIKNLTKALVAAQSQMGAAVKGAKNPFFKSNYSDLPTVMEVVKGPLNDNGLLVLQPSAHREGKNFIDTVIIHGESGEFISSETEVICAKQNSAQDFGAGQTYARRFGLQAMLFIPCENDDDGNMASGRSALAKPVYQAPAKTSTYAHVVTAPTVANTTASSSVVVPAASPIDPVAEMAADPAPVAPLQKSSFRKGAKAPAATQAVTVAPSESEWG